MINQFHFVWSFKLNWPIDQIISGVKPIEKEASMDWTKSPDVSFASLTSLNPAVDVVDVPVEDVEDVCEGWASVDGEAAKEDRGGVGEEVEDDEVEEEGDEEEEEDDDDDMTNHFRLKEEEAIQMGIKSPWRIVRSRYYIASASHIISLYNILLHGSTVLNDASHDIRQLTQDSSNSFNQMMSSSSKCYQLSQVPSAPAASTSQAPSAALPSLSPPVKHITTSSSTQQLSSTEFLSPERAPVLLDADARKDAEEVADVHYLSHIVFRYDQSKVA